MISCPIISVSLSQKLLSLSPPTFMRDDLNENGCSWERIIIAASQCDWPKIQTKERKLVALPISEHDVSSIGWNSPTSTTRCGAELEIHPLGPLSLLHVQSFWIHVWSSITIIFFGSPLLADELVEKWSLDTVNFTFWILFHYHHYLFELFPLLLHWFGKSGQLLLVACVHKCADKLHYTYTADTTKFTLHRELLDESHRMTLPFTQYPSKCD